MRQEGSCNAYGSPRTGGGGATLGLHRILLCPRWGLHAGRSGPEVGVHGGRGISPHSPLPRPRWCRQLQAAPQRDAMSGESDGDEEPTPIRKFLEPLRLTQHRETLRQLGYDDPEAELEAQSPEDAQEMKDALLGKGVPVGHVAKIMRTGAALKAARNEAPSGLPLQPASAPELTAGTDAGPSEPWKSAPGQAALVSATVSATAEQSALIQTSINQATSLRDQMHQAKVCHAAVGLACGRHTRSASAFAHSTLTNCKAHWPCPLRMPSGHALLHMPCFKIR